MNGARPRAAAGSGPAAAGSYLACAGTMLELLEQEHQALQASDYERLAAVGRNKARIVIQLGELLVALANPAANPIPAEQRLPLKRLIQLCQQHTGINESLLEARALRARRTLHALRADAGHYDRRGLAQYSLAGRVRGSA